MLHTLVENIVLTVLAGDISLKTSVSIASLVVGVVYLSLSVCMPAICERTVDRPFNRSPTGKRSFTRTSVRILCVANEGVFAGAESA